MSGRRTHAYCPTCAEESAIDRQGHCLWCGGETTTRKRGGWKRPDRRGSRYSEAQLQALYRAYQGGASINSLAKQTHERVGYRNPTSAAAAISREWKRMGLPVRDRIEQVRKTCTKHGMAPKHGSRAGYSKLRRERGIGGWAYQPRCKGVRSQYPRKGARCERPAIEGSEFCHVHDPARRAQVEAVTAKMRKRQPERETVPMEPFTEWLRGLHAELGSWRAVGELLDLSTSAVNCYGRGISPSTKQPLERIGADVVRRCHERAEEFAEAGEP